MAKATFYYPSLIWPGGQIDFDEAYRIVIPPEQGIGNTNVAASGLQETVLDRIETTVSLLFWPISTTRLNQVRTYWRTWGVYQKPSTLILDRFDTCGGQYEYDNYNRFFTRAILTSNPFAPTRQQGVESRSLYAIKLDFRQDGG